MMRDQVVGQSGKRNQFTVAMQSIEQNAEQSQPGRVAKDFKYCGEEIQVMGWFFHKQHNTSTCVEVSSDKYHDLVFE